MPFVHVWVCVLKPEWGDEDAVDAVGGSCTAHVVVVGNRGIATFVIVKMAEEAGIVAEEEIAPVSVSIYVRGKATTNACDIGVSRSSLVYRSSMVLYI